MTLAPSRAVTTHQRAAPVVGSVTAIVVVHDGDRWLVDTLDSLALQSTPPSRLIVVDTGSEDTSAAILDQHARIRSAIRSVRILRLARSTPFAAAVDAAVETLPPQTDGEWLWLLHDDTAPTPLTLQRLLDASRRSPSVAVVGPKVTMWDEPRRFRSLGLQYTRSGRPSGSPAIGERDQGQYDDRGDVLGVGTAGMLLTRAVFDQLGGFDHSFSGSADGLDFSWRAHLAGHRVIVAPKAMVREAAASETGQRADGPSATAAERRSRRRARQVALSRCSLILMPLMAVWIALSSLVSALALLVVKRPRRAWRELADVGALFAGARLWGARWRFRGKREVRRRHLQGLFVPPRTSLRHTIDGIQDSVAFEGAHPRQTARDPQAYETGPISPDVESLAQVPATWPQRVIRHPGFLAVLAAAVLAAMTWRTLLGSSALTGSGLGLTGGELAGIDTDASGLWHAWLDGWHGSGLGDAAEGAPYLPVLAALTWLVGHVPWVAASGSPAGTAVGWLLVAAIPLSAWTAYLAGRVLIPARWPRAWGALAWASLASLTTALGSGRLGAVVAHVLLPLVLAGLLLAARRKASTPVTFGTALAIAVLGVFDPPLLALALVMALLVMVFGRGWARLRGLLLVVVPLGLIGPWLLRVVDDPRLLLTGPGLVVWDGATVRPWELALLHPGGPGSYPVLLSAPLVLVGVLALGRHGRSRGALPAGPLSVLGLLGLLGLAFAIGAPRLVVGTVPAHSPGAGQPLTPWPGTGLDLLALALLASALVAAQALLVDRPWRDGGNVRLLTRPLALLAVAGVVTSAGFAGWVGIGDRLQPTPDLMPAVAMDQATGPSATRLLVLAPGPDETTYALHSSEPGPIARDVPVAHRAPDPLLRKAVQLTVAGDLAASDVQSQAALADLGVGFVGLRGEVGNPLVRRLDSTAGLARLSDSGGLVLWRVLPQAATSTRASVAPSRVRVLDPAGVPIDAVASTGPHSRLATELPAGAAGRQLVVSEDPAWADQARVTFDAQVLQPVAGTARPTYSLPASAGSLDVRVEATHSRWRWAQLALLALTAFLAVPFGNRRSRRVA